MHKIESVRVAFLGTSAFAVPALRDLHCQKAVGICAVVTQEDRPAGRGHHLQLPPVKQAAQALRLPIYQPLKIRSEESNKFFQELNPDLLVVVAYGQILPAWLLKLPRYGAVNVHASLLPKYRGAAPIQWALLAGERDTGVTIMQMDEGMDTGPILLQQKVSVSLEETAGELHDRLAILGAGLLIKTLELLFAGGLEPIPQDDECASLAIKITKEMGSVDWRLQAIVLHNRIRALNPWPGCACSFRGNQLKIWRSKLSDFLNDQVSSRKKPGRIKLGSQGSLFVECGDGHFLELLEVNLPSRKRISGVDLVHGMKIEEGEYFENPPLPPHHAPQ